MRRRDRFRNLGWLQWMADDQGEGMVRDTHMPPQAVHDSMNTLIRRYKRYVDMEQLGDGYRVRVMPAYGSEEIGPANFGACYTGLSLPRLLTTAVVELDMIADGTLPYRVGAVERWRWVP